MTDPVSEMQVAPRRRGVGLSVVWIVPVVAVGVASFIAWRSIEERGPLIEIAFETASGLAAGQTELRFRSVKVGVVETVTFTEDLTAVLAHVRIDKDIAPFIDDSAKFWLVQPEITARGVTGLDTVLSGVFIEGTWDDQQGSGRKRFTGATQAPLRRAGQDGTIVELRAESGGRIQGGAPVVYRGVTVGSIATPVLAPDGTRVTAEAFIEAPYNRLLTSNTRFWGAGGFSVNVGAGGLKVDVANIASLIEGGVEFGAVASGGRVITDGTGFTVFSDRETAQRTFFDAAGSNEVVFRTVFDGAAQGLEVGDHVVLSGVTVGQVRDIGAFITEGDDPEVQMRVDFALRPELLGLPEEAEPQAVIDHIARAIDNGLHAQLSVGGFLTTTIQVDLVDDDTIPPGELTVDGDNPPVIPALPVEVGDLAASARGIADRIAALPVERVVDEVVALLGNVNTVIAAPELREAPKAAMDLLNTARETLESIEPGPLLAEVQGGIADLRRLLGQVGSEANIAQVETILARASELAATLDTAAQELPGLIAAVEDVAQTAATLDLDPLVASATETANSLKDLVAAPETRALPGELQSTIAEVRRLLASEDVQALPGQVSQAVGNAAALVADLQQSDGYAALLSALERSEAIAASVEASADEVPALIASLKEVSDTAAALDLQGLVDQVEGAIASVEALASDERTRALPGQVAGLIEDTRGLIASPEVQALPGQIGDTVDAAGTMIRDLQSSEAYAALLSALERTAAIVASVESTVDGLPQLRARIDGILAEVDALPLESTLAAARDVLATGRNLLEDTDEADLPQALAGTLTEVEATLADLRAGGTVENVNATLASASEAADAIAEATRSLPALAARLETLVAETEALIGAYGDRSAFNAQTLATLHDLRTAARAATSLIQTIERNPSALIRGR